MSVTITVAVTDVLLEHPNSFSSYHMFYCITMLPKVLPKKIMYERHTPHSFICRGATV